MFSSLRASNARAYKESKKKGNHEKTTYIHTYVSMCVFVWQDLFLEWVKKNRENLPWKKG